MSFGQYFRMSMNELQQRGWLDPWRSLELDTSNLITDHFWLAHKIGKPVNTAVDEMDQHREMLNVTNLPTTLGDAVDEAFSQERDS